MNTFVAPANCRASSPANCRYHGNSSSSYTRLLKNKLKVAIDTYSAVKNKKNAFEAYSTLREIQKEYYATDSGIQEIQKLLSDGNLNDSKKEQAELIYAEALQKRYSYEQELDIGSIFPPLSVKQYKELPSGTGDMDNFTNLSTFNTDDSKTNMINWDKNSGSIFYSCQKETSVEIGKASSLHEATIKATTWFNEKYN